MEFDIENTSVVLVLDENFFKASPSFKNQPHSHSKHEFFFVKQGECIINIKEEEYRLHKNNFIVIPARMNHNICYKSENALIFPTKFQFHKNHKKIHEINFDLTKLLNFLISQNNTPQIFCACIDMSKKLDNLIDIVYTQSFLYKEYLNAAFKQFFIDAILYIYNSCENYQKKSDIFKKCHNIPLVSSKTHKTQNISAEDKNKQIYTDIIETYSGEFYNKHSSLTDLAKLLQLSPNHTSRILKQFYGVSFMELMMQTRISIAKKMMIETELSLETVAEHVGYDSYNGFSRAFRKLTGKLPSEFRKN